MSIVLNGEQSCNRKEWIGEVAAWMGWDGENDVRLERDRFRSGWLMDRATVYSWGYIYAW